MQAAVTQVQTDDRKETAVMLRAVDPAAQAEASGARVAVQPALTTIGWRPKTKAGTTGEGIVEFQRVHQDATWRLACQDQLTQMM